MLRASALVLLFSCSPIAQAADADKPDKPATPASATVPAKPAVSMEDIRLFTAVFGLVKQAYVEPVDDKALMQAAVHGLLSGLDPHSEYLDARAMDQLSEDTSGSYDGLGLEVLSAEGTLRVIAPIDDTPAERAGIKSGDIITRIDDKTITSDNANEAVNMLRGKSGSSVMLSVLHEGANSPIDL